MAGTAGPDLCHERLGSGGGRTARSWRVERPELLRRTAKRPARWSNADQADRAERYQVTTALSASPRADASSAEISTTRRPPPSRGTPIPIPRPSFVTSRGPSPVRGFMAAMYDSLHTVHIGPLRSDWALLATRVQFIRTGRWCPSGDRPHQ